MMALSKIDSAKRNAAKKNKKANIKCEICNKLLSYKNVTNRCRKHSAGPCGKHDK